MVLTKQKFISLLNNDPLIEKIDLTYITDKDLQNFTFFCGRGALYSGVIHLGHYLLYKKIGEIGNMFKDNRSVLFQYSDDEGAFKSGKIEKNIERGVIEKKIKSLLNLDNMIYYQNTKQMGELYPALLPLLATLNIKDIKKIFGFDDAYCVGRFFYPLVQLRVGLQQKGKVIVLTGKDQLPYFTALRDRLGFQRREKFGFIIFKNIPDLKGNPKMSSSVPEGVLSLDETRERIEKKIKKMFSLGGRTLEENQKKDIKRGLCPVLLLISYLQKNRMEFKQVKNQYIGGEMPSTELKKNLLLLLLARKKELSRGL
jgi:tryptophanyl-tRNA synthetase